MLLIFILLLRVRNSVYETDPSANKNEIESVNALLQMYSITLHFFKSISVD